MKRHGNLFCKITDPKNIALAHNLAKRGKSRYAEVQMVNKDPEKYFQDIQESLGELPRPEGRGFLLHGQHLHHIDVM